MRLKARLFKKGYGLDIEGQVTDNAQDNANDKSNAYRNPDKQDIVPQNTITDSTTKLEELKQIEQTREQLNPKIPEKVSADLRYSMGHQMADYLWNLGYNSRLIGTGVALSVILDPLGEWSQESRWVARILPKEISLNTEVGVREITESLADWLVTKGWGCPNRDHLGDCPTYRFTQLK